MNSIRIAVLASLPIQSIIPSDSIPSKFQKRFAHPAPCASSLIKALNMRGNISIRVFSRSRILKTQLDISKDSIRYTLLPQKEPARLGAWHLHAPARIQLNHALSSYEPDLVIGFGTESAYALAASDQSCPNIVFVQGILEKIHKFGNRYSKLHDMIRRRLEKIAIHNTRGIITETYFAKDWARTINTTAPIAVIPHIVDSQFLNIIPTYKENIAVYIGSLQHIKGIDTCIRALAFTKDSSLGLSIIGNGALLPSLKELAIKLKVSHRVNFRGFLSKADIISQLSQAKMLTILSRMDTSPNVLTEAHAAGIPVIGSRAGGIPEMIDHGIDGFLVDSNDIMTAAKMMDKLSSDLSLCRKLGLAGKKKVEEFNHPERIAQMHERFYNKILHS